MKKLLVVIVIIALSTLSELFYLSVKANFYTNKPINWSLLYASIAALILLVVVFYWSLYSSIKPKRGNDVGEKDVNGKTVSKYQSRLEELAKNHKRY